MKFFSIKPTRRQCIDAGMAVVLIMLLTGYFSGNILFYKLAIPLLVINMIVPGFYYPFAICWFGFSGMLGNVVSRLLLTVIYFIIVFPVGFIRRLSGKDNLQINSFKRSENSVMIKRDHTYTGPDLEKPY